MLRVVVLVARHGARDQPRLTLMIQEDGRAVTDGFGRPAHVDPDDGLKETPFGASPILYSSLQRRQRMKSYRHCRFSTYGTMWYACLQ